ncbi:CHASE domain-containing protein [Eleftheria terrae]|uniref:CHASE domain-containing protein n=1 Tax=Eleftheria terrae TaxID=1597781 RepID=UPI00263B510C|nr:CHASE domain-containing protein [Eleftheria terrae]WKB50694.1 CHASE domain-containing protein [Eleftheria terrae]
MIPRPSGDPAAQQRAAGRGTGRRLRAWVVLVAGLLLSAAAALLAVRLQERAAQHDLRERARIVAGIVEQRVGRWAEVLQGVRGLFAARAGTVSAAEFRDYYDHLELPRRYPGFLSLQFVRHVPHAQKDAFEAAVRSDRSLLPGGNPGFVVRPPGTRPDYYVTHYIEPMAGNQVAFGFDAAATTARREALERARDAGTMIGSGRLQLVQTGPQAGYVLRAPVYRAGMPRDTVAQRRAAFIGLATVALHMEDFITALLPDAQLEHLDFRLNDLGWAGQAVAAPTPGNLLYDTSARRPVPRRSEAALVHVIDVPVGGRLWRFEFQERNGALGLAQPLLVALAGGLISVLVFRLLQLQSAARERLEARVAERTAELALANEALRSSEERLELALAGADLALWDWDLANDTLVWNQRWLEMRGYRADEAKSEVSFWKSLIHPEDRPAVLAALQAHLEGRQPAYSAEYRVRTRDGHWLWLLDRGRVVARDAAGRPLRITGTNLDISERKRGEEDRVTAATASRLASVKDEFMARMSHELRTPLNAILGFAQLLERDPSSLLTPSQLERVQQIQRAGAHLVAMVSDLLDLSAIEGGRVPMARQPVMLGEVLSEALDLVRSQAQAAGVTLIDRVGPSRDAVMADPLRLRQVMVNLLTNAIKYNRRGGSVTVAAQSRGAQQRAVSVADTGVGLRAEQIGKLFQPFERLGAQRSEIPGTGLGLALSRRLVDMMGGHIEVSSEVGHGACFTLVLPACRAGEAGGAPPMAAPPEPPASDLGLTVLYVEDDDVNVTVVQGMLALRPSVRLLIARSGAKALELLAHERPDLLLVDMQLGDMHGIELRRRLAADPALAAVPCVGLSGDALPAQRQAALDAGFEQYLTKPVQLDELLGVIDRQARARAAQPQARAGGRS